MKEFINTLDNDVPVKLFKYGSARGFQLESLRERSLYLAPPELFNDPFDCRPVFAWESMNLDELMRDMIHVHAEDLSDGTTNSYREQQEILRSQLPGDPNDLPAHVEENIARHMNSVGIHCLASEKDNILMWSHYGDNHRGLVIEYDTAQLWKCVMSEGAVLERVRYEKDRPQLILSPGGEWVMHMIFTKSEDWAYENEYRIVHKSGSRTKINLPQSAITGIYLGSKFPSMEGLVEIMESMRAAKLNCPIHYGHIDNHKFVVTFEQVPIIST